MQSGVVPIIKPPGLTSQQVVSIFRRLTGVKKAGHTGTLDPAASGLLVVCFGEATRLIEYADRYPKRYRAEITLGWSTDTQDSTGTVTCETRDFRIGLDEFDDILNQFVGEIEQIPPMVSAIKHGGVRLYELARRGETVKRRPRRITIYSLKRFCPDQADGSSDSGELTFGSTVMFDVECSSGTYVRTLCEDIGARLGVQANMSYLVRLAASGFTLDDAVTLEEVPTLPQWSCINQGCRREIAYSKPAGPPPFPMEYLVRDLPRVTCLPREDRLVANGVVPHRLSNSVAELDVQRPGDNLLSIFLSTGDLGAIGRIRSDRGLPQIALEKVFARGR